MLTIAQKEHLRKIDQRLYETVIQMENAINQMGINIGSAPYGVFPTPPAPNSLSVTAANGIANVQITDNYPIQNPTKAKVMNYFVEAATDPAFANVVHSEHLGPFRNKNIMLGNQTLYFRAYSQFYSSGPSKFAVYGGSTPTAVTVGGVAAPTQQPYTGSGTSKISGTGYGHLGRFTQ